jgi:hypothetical protein
MSDNPNQEIRHTSYSGSDIRVIAYPSFEINKVKQTALNAKEKRRDQLLDERETADIELGAVLYREESLLEFGTEPLIDSDSRKNLAEDPSVLEPFHPPYISEEMYTEQLDDLQRRKKAAQSQIDEVDFQLEEFKSNGDSPWNADFFFELGSLSAISYSMFREKFAVRSLGSVQAKSYTRGPRTIAGTMVFTLLNEFELDKLSAYYKRNTNVTITLLDQLPPFNLIFLFSNEYGATSVMHLFNVELNSEGQSHSIDDLMISKTTNFYARDLIPLKNQGFAFRSYTDMIRGVSRYVSPKIPSSISDSESIVTFESIVEQYNLPIDDLSANKKPLSQILRFNNRTTI